MRLGLGIGLNRLRKAAGGAPPPPAFSPADLFLASEAGFWAPVEMSRLWQDVARTTPVTATGQSVASWELTTASGVIYAEQGTAAARPIYRENANGRGYLDFDAADDTLIAAFTPTGTLDYVMSYVPVARNSIAFHNQTGSGYWVGAATSGSSATNISDSFAIRNASYFDNVLSSNTTQGQNYTSVQASTRLHVNVTIAGGEPSNVRIGKYNGGTWYAPGDVYGIMVRQGTLDSTQRANLDAWMAALQNP